MSASEAAPWLSMFFGMFVSQLPTLVVVLVGAILLLTRWKQIPRAAPWALAGCGLTLLLCFAIPAAQALLQFQIMQDGAHRYISIMGAVSLLWAVLHAGSYVLLLIGVFAGRTTTVLPPPVRIPA